MNATEYFIGSEDIQCLRVYSTKYIPIIKHRIRTQNGNDYEILVFIIFNIYNSTSVIEINIFRSSTAY